MTHLPSPDQQSDALKERIRIMWDAEAPHYDPVDHKLRGDIQAWEDFLQVEMGDQPLKILDIGVGTGFLALPLAKLGHQVTGLDQSTRMLEITRQKATANGLAVELCLGDAEAPDFPDETFDVVINRWVIWLLPNPEQAMREWLRITKPGGRIYALTSIEEHDRNPKEFRARLCRQLGLLLNSIAQRRNAWYWAKHNRQINEELPLTSFDQEALERKVALFKQHGLVAVECSAMDAINEARQVQLQNRPWRDRLLLGDGCRSTFYAIQGQKQGEVTVYVP